jgi:hypothetical protein
MYRVVWEWDSEADTPHEAVEEAFAAMRDPESIATFFDVFAADGTLVTSVDLWEEGLQERGII